MKTIKRRTQNFCGREETTLIALVKRYKNYIECKKTDSSSNKCKLKAWIQLAKEFNSAGGEVHRDHGVLRNKYNNLKKRCKQKFAAEKNSSLYKTSGGIDPPVIITPLDNEIKEIMGTQINGFDSELDSELTDSFIISSDSPVYEVKFEDNVQEIEDNSLDLEYNIVNEQKEVQQAFAVRIEPANIIQAIPKEIPNKANELTTDTNLTRTRNNSISQSSEWNQSKTQLTQNDERAAEIHALKLKQMQELHEKQLIESDLRYHILKEEHELKMKILKLELRKLQNSVTT